MAVSPRHKITRQPQTMKRELTIHLLPSCESEALSKSTSPFSLIPWFGRAFSDKGSNHFNRFTSLFLVSLLSALTLLTAQAQEQLNQNPVLDPYTTVIGQSPYAITTRDGNQKIWSKVTWESNSISG